MLINSLLDMDGSRCMLTFEQPDGWLRATWCGFIAQDEALRGAENYLAHAEAFYCPYLLNDNGALRGPWFDSTDWLERVWLPRALEFGLRYVAHVVQADTHTDIRTLAFPQPLVGVLDLQMFDRVADAEAWQCQTRF